MAIRIKIRRGTASDWTSANPTLAAGEFGFETDTNKLKVGDGANSWTGLSYVTGTGVGVGITDILEDTTPQLGGNLDVNGNAIVSVSDGDIEITPNGSGQVVIDNLRWPTTDGSPDHVLKTDGSGNLTFAAIAGSGTVTSVQLAVPSGFAVAGGPITSSGTITISIDDAETIRTDIGAVGSPAVVTPSAGVADVAAGSITGVVTLSATQYADLTSTVPTILYVIV